MTAKPSPGRLPSSPRLHRKPLATAPTPVQRRGALVLALGGLAEMATGEGKTTVVALWAAIAGWSRKPCHIVTANDYLARRDAEVMAPFYTAVGLSVGSVTGDMPRQGRGEVYARDLVYTTSKELLADFLRDRIQMGRALDPTLRFIRSLRHPGTPGKKESTVLRGIHTAIVDEADSVLIDEAVTPLRISSKTPHDSLKTAYRHCSRMVRQLRPGKDYLVNQRFREIKLLDQGWDNLEDAFGGLSKEWATPERFEEIINHSLEAREFYKVDRDYIIKEGKIQIVDSFTGRTLPDRSWSQGLHQAIEAKEEIELTDPSETLASLSFQRFFRLFFRLSGLTGTAMEAADEFWRIYAMPVIRVPRNKPLQRVGLSDRLFPGRKEKWKTLFQVVQQAHESGQPILVGTPTVGDSEHLASILEKAGLPFRLLNAVKSEEEADIIAQSGHPFRITIATNMAGRGTDIRLRGNSVERGGLLVIATERHSARRIDRQLFGRSGRQGEPGKSMAFLSFEDDLIHQHCPPVIAWWGKTLLTLNRHLFFLPRPPALLFRPS
jgi:preprotein translocase subunit SecA